MGWWTLRMASMERRTATVVSSILASGYQFTCEQTIHAGPCVCGVSWHMSEVCVVWAW